MTLAGATRRPSIALLACFASMAFCSAPASGADAPAEPVDRAPREPTGVVSLRDALAAALVGSPGLRAFSAEMRVREALALQAGLRPNPELRVELEDLGGSGDRQGFEQAETTIRLSQLIELGGKRHRRARVAVLGAELAAWDYESRRLDVLGDASRAFVTTLAVQERLALVSALARLAEGALKAVERSVRAGASAPIETTRARVALGRAELERARAERDLQAARSLLAASWGGSRAVFIRVAGDLETLEPLPSEERVLAALEHNPDVARWATEHAEREAALALARAQAVPDLTVGAGGRHFTDTGDNAAVLELSVPLPLFDRNQGALVAAARRLDKARDEAEAARTAARATLARAYATLASAHDQATVLRHRVLRDAQTSFTGSLDAFGKGLLRPVDVLEAERTLFELRVEYVRALESFHLAAAEIERLTATPLHDLTHGVP